MKDLLSQWAQRDIVLDVDQHPVSLKVSPRPLADSPYCIGFSIEGHLYTIMFDDDTISGLLSGVKEPLSSLPENLALAVSSLALKPLLALLGVIEEPLEWAPLVDEPYSFIPLVLDNKAKSKPCFLSIGTMQVGEAFLLNLLESFPKLEEGKTHIPFSVRFGHTAISQKDLSQLASGDVLLIENDYRQEGSCKVSFPAGVTFSGELQNDTLEVRSYDAEVETSSDNQSEQRKVIFEYRNGSLDLLEAVNVGPGYKIPGVCLESGQIVICFGEEILATGAIVRLNDLNGVLIS